RRRPRRCSCRGRRPGSPGAPRRGEKDPAIAVAFRDQKVVPPRNHVADLDVATKADQVTDDRQEVGVRWQRRMQRELFARSLRDQRRSRGIDEQVVASLAGDYPLIEVLGAEDHLYKLPYRATPLQPDAEFPAHRAGAAVATGEIGTAQRILASIDRAREYSDA